MKNHKDLDAWKRSINLVVDIYNITKHFPQEEIYGLTNQIRRAAVSVPSNIAEGAARGSKPDFRRFLNISQGSLAELETQLIISEKLNYINKSEIFDDIDEIRKMNWGLINHLNKSIK